jgi:sulfofructosephosphate aldolase
MTAQSRLLDPIATAHGTFAIVAMDQRNTLKRMFAAVNRPDVTAEEMIALKVAKISALRGSASAFLLDPTYGVPALHRVAKAGPRFGTLVAAEPSERAVHQGEPVAGLDPRQDAAWVRSQGGDALKFLVQLRADRRAGAGQRDLRGEALEVVRKLVADCRARGVPSVVENLLYAAPNEAPASPQQRADRIIEAAVALAECKPDLLKLEYPGDVESCRRLARSIQVPWAVLSAGVAFDKFAGALRVACDDGGCCGFIAGRSIWQEAVGMKTTWWR